MQLELKLKHRESGATRLSMVDLPVVPAVGQILDFGTSNRYEIENIIYSFEGDNDSLRVITVVAFLLLS